MVDTINNILFWICLWVLLWNAYFLIFNRGIPNIRTAPAIRKSIITRLQKDVQQANKDTPFIIYDLGCGNGKFTREIASAIPNAHVIGIEISKPAYWHACALQKIFSLKNLSYRNSDFYKVDITDANAIVMFLCGTLMKNIREKLETDLKDNVHVYSNKFKVGGDWAELETVNVKTLYPHQKTYFTYNFTQKH